MSDKMCKEVRNALIIFVAIWVLGIGGLFASASAQSWSEIIKGKAKEVEVKGWFAPEKKKVWECHVVGYEMIKPSKWLKRTPITECKEK